MDRIYDRRYRAKTQAQRDLLMAEVNHRVKNSLATVVSIAHHSFKEYENFDVPLRSFEGRIRALAQTHTRLSEVNWSHISLQAIVDDELAPYRTDRNVCVVGPEVGLNPKCAVSLGMAIHELATNAAKYGAPSVEEGTVEISWEHQFSDKRLRFCWIESGGPKGRSAATQRFRPAAFGTGLGFGSELRGEARVRCSGVELRDHFRS